MHWTIGLVTAFYTLVMTLGYTYGVCTGGVSDNILNNFGVDDMLMNTGRVGLAVTILVSFPLLTVPLIGTLVRAHREMSSECGCQWHAQLVFIKSRFCGRGRLVFLGESTVRSNARLPRTECLVHTSLQRTLTYMPTGHAHVNARSAVSFCLCSKSHSL